MDDNVYKTPESALLSEQPTETILASRGRRLGAAMLDGLSIMVVSLPVMYFTGGFDGIAQGVQPSFAYSLAMGALGLVVFALINFQFLKATGQTLGKKALSIKIVTVDGHLPTLGNHTIKRYGVYFVPGQIPVVGQIFSMLNILFIFGKSKRCIHDYAAGTMVVNS